MKFLIASWLFCAGMAVAQSKPGIGDLLSLAFSANPQDKPKDCDLLTGSDVVYRCNNGTSPLLKISSFDMDTYPIAPGAINFKMIYKLTEPIKQGSTLHIQSYSDMQEEIFDGELDLCNYLAFANIKCPVFATDGFSQMKQTLEVPNDVPPGTYSFVATAKSHEGKEFLRVAANMQLENPHLTIEHDDL